MRMCSVPHSDLQAGTQRNFRGKFRASGAAEKRVCSLWKLKTTFWLFQWMEWLLLAMLPSLSTSVNKVWCAGLIIANGCKWDSISRFQSGWSEKGSCGSDAKASSSLPMTACLAHFVESKVGDNFHMLQVIVDVMAGFKPKPDTRDIRSFCVDLLQD